MHFEPSEEQRLIEKVAREFAQQVLRPLAAERDQKSQFPERELMQSIVRVHFPDLTDRLLDDCLVAFYSLRELPGLRKRPSTSELLDWIAALRRSGVDTARLGLRLPFLGTLVKNERDLEVVAAAVGRRR